jgi:thiazole synthase
MHQLTIAGKAYRSRLLVGTGKYKDFAETRAAIDASGAEIITVAVRRFNIGQDASQPSLLDAVPPAQFTILPNTAGCYSADDAVRLSEDDSNKKTLLKLWSRGGTVFAVVDETGSSSDE